MSRPPAPLAAFIGGLDRLLGSADAEEDVLRGGRRLLGALVAEDGWLPPEFARPDPERYRQYLLHREPRGRFSIVSFVWGPGQSTPIHDHQCGGWWAC